MCAFEGAQNNAITNSDAVIGTKFSCTELVGHRNQENATASVEIFEKNSK